MHVAVGSRSSHRVRIAHEPPAPEITRRLAEFGITASATTVVTVTESPTPDARGRWRRSALGDMERKREREREHESSGGGRDGNGGGRDAMIDASIGVKEFERRLQQLTNAYGMPRVWSRDQEAINRYRERGNYAWRTIARPRAADHYVAQIGDSSMLRQLCAQWAARSTAPALDRRQLHRIGVPEFATDLLWSGQFLGRASYRAQCAALDSWELIWALVNRAAAPKRKAALARHMVRVFETHAAVCVAYSVDGRRSPGDDAVSDQAVAILGRLVRVYCAAAEADTVLNRFSAAAHCVRRAIVLSVAIYGATSDVTAVTIGVWQNVSRRESAHFAHGMADVGKAVLAASVLQIADDWIVRCDRERRRRRLHALIDALTSRYAFAAGHVDWYRSMVEPPAATSPPWEMSRLRVTARVCDLAWRNLWRGLVGVAQQLGRGASTLSAAYRSAWVDAVIEHAPIAVTHTRQWRRRRRQHDARSSSLSALRETDDAALAATTTVTTATVRSTSLWRLSPVSPRVVMHLVAAARVAMCDAWRLETQLDRRPARRSREGSDARRRGSMATGSGGGTKKRIGGDAKKRLRDDPLTAHEEEYVRAIALDSATGRVYARLGKWRDAVGPLRRASVALLKLHCRSYNMSRSWRFFETAVHLLDALHATGQHREAQFIAINFASCHAHGVAADTAAKSIPADDADKARLAQWHQRLSLQCAYIGWLRCFRSLCGLVHTGSESVTAGLADLGRTSAPCDAALDRGTWRGPLWRSVVAARRVLASSARKNLPP